MAYNIKPLRQQNLFDQYGMLSLGDLTGDSYSYGNEDQDQDPTNRSVPDRRTPMPSDTRVTSADISALRGPNVTLSSPSSSRSSDKNDDLMSMINSIYTPSTADRDRFRSLLDNAPTREEPGFGRKFAASLIGLGNKSRGIPGGIGEMEKVMYAPYIRDMMEWKEKTGPYQQAASLENTANINERTLAGNVVSADIQGKRIAEQARQADDRNATAAEKIRSQERIAILRNNVDKMKASGWKFDNKGLTIIATRTNPETGQPETIDTGVKTNEVDPIELETLKGDYRVKVADMNNAAAMDRTIQSGQNAVTTKSTPSGTSATPKAGDETKIRTEVLQRLYDTDPDARKWITKNQNGVLDLKPRPVVGGGKTMGMFGTAYTQKDVDEYDAVARAAHPNVSGTVTGVKFSGAGGGDLRQKAADFLKSNGQLVTDANIQHAIKMGWVK